MKARNIESSRDKSGINSTDLELPQNNQSREIDRPEAIAPKRRDEAEDEYKFRTMLHEDESSSVARVDLVARRIEAGAGVSLSDLMPRELISLSNYYLSNSRRNHSAVIDFAKKYGVKGLKAFLAGEYGEVLGDQLIEIGEKADHEEAVDLFGKYEKLTKKISAIETVLDKVDFSELPSKLNEIFSIEFNEALMRRSKDLLMATGELIADENVASAQKDAALESIEALGDMIDIICGLAADNGQTRYEYIRERNAPGDQSGSNVFTVYDRSRDALYKLRTFVRSISNKDGQARINFELAYNTVKPDVKREEIFLQEIIYSPNNPSKYKSQEVSSLRLGIDLETGGESPAVSLDIGRAAYDGENLKRSGDVIGNALKRYDRVSGHHTTASFKSELADPENFSIIAGRFANWLNKL